MEGERFEHKSVGVVVNMDEVGMNFVVRTDNNAFCLFSSLCTCMRACVRVCVCGGGCSMVWCVCV